MAKKAIKVLAYVALAELLAGAMGRLLSAALTHGDEASDDFGVAAVFEGKRFRSIAGRLRTARVITALGGMELDLRGARLDPAGADVEMRTTLGGVQVFVPDDWAVEVHRKTLGGGFDSQVTPIDDLPPDAPRLRVHASTVLGGGLITIKAL